MYANLSPKTMLEDQVNAGKIEKEVESNLNCAHEISELFKDENFKFDLAVMLKNIKKNYRKDEFDNFEALEDLADLVEKEMREKVTSKYE